jgi:light-regulated signal transduction histidine kinase (bacteriophytochrome)
MFTVGTTYYITPEHLNHWWMPSPNERVLISNVRDNPAVDPYSREVYNQQNIHSVAALCFAVQEKWSHIIIILWDQPQQFSEVDSFIYAELQSMIAAAIVRFDERQHYTKLEETAAQYHHAVRARQNAVDDFNRLAQEFDAFIYSIGHDLRNPIRYIRMLIEQFEDLYQHILKPNEQQQFAKIYEKFQEYNNALEALVRLYQRIGKPNVRAVDLKRIALEAWEIACTKAEASLAKACTFYVEELPIYHGDEALLQLVFVNLFSNAIKFSHPERPLAIEVSFTRDNNHQGVYCVRDNGIGFDMQYAAKLFIPFQRMHSAAKYTGMGIVLATVKRIISSHHGKIWFNAHINEGAAFFFTLGDMTENYRSD